MHCYRRVAYEDRCQISAFLQAGISILHIAQCLGFHKTTIYREIKRNRTLGSYEPIKATKKAFERFKRCKRPKKINEAIKEKIVVYLEFGWSPEQIAGRLRREKAFFVSHQTIYRSLNKRHREVRLLRRFGKRGAGRRAQKKAKSAGLLMISERPTIVEQERRFGDWERDGMYGANRKQLLVLNERKSMLVLLTKMFDTTSKHVAELTLNTLKPLNKRVHTMTNDNGSEFRESKSLPFATYYCDPYKPQQRGKVENTIGLLRQYIRRDTNLEKLTEDELKKIERKLNFRPRKRLDYKTPFEVFFRTNVALAI